MNPGKIVILLLAATAGISTTVFSQSANPIKKQTMETATLKNDMDILYELNTRFIRNFIAMDTNAHNQIIHPDFTCINPDGSISGRKEYMEAWANGYVNAGYTSFTMTAEKIRLFGNMALVRAKTVYTKPVNGQTIHGATVYTDTYIKENGRWWCVQAQITPVK